MDSAVAEPLDPDDPRAIGRFTVLGLLGAGGMGEVYLGVGEDGYVAVKRVRPRWVSGERFNREIGILHRVPAGVAPRVLASDSSTTRPWFAAEYVPGLTVADAVRAHGPLPADALWRLLSETAARLRAVHEVAIVHRDLSPSNVMLLRDGVKLIDFGIARAADQERLTRTGAGFGTSGFAAPEQEAGDAEAAPAADVYSLAAVLLYAATGATPGRVPDVAALRAVDPDLADIVEPCLATDPDARPTAARLAEDGALRRRGVATNAADGAGAAGAAGAASTPDAAWPPAVMERIAAREAFAATPVGEMETLAPPTGTGLDVDQSPDVLADPEAETHASARAGAAGSSSGKEPPPTPPMIDGPRSAPRGHRRRLIIFPLVVGVVAAGGVAAFMLAPQTSNAPVSQPATTTATGFDAVPAGGATASGSASRSASPSPVASVTTSITASAPADSTEPTLPSGATASVSVSTAPTTRAATTAAGGGPNPTASSVPGVSGDDDSTQVPGSEADTDWVGNDAACSAWLDNGGDGTLAGVLNTSLTQSCVAELFRSDGMAYTFSASWGAEKTNFISDVGYTMWICVWHADDQSSDEECSARFGMNGDTPVQH
jgi:predicted Ser/Thr protein kinase